MYIVPDEKGNLTGHNKYNFGNFLWGGAAQSVGLSLPAAQAGAHYNNFLNDDKTRGQLDSQDDQFSIEQGYNYRKSQTEKKKQH